MIIEFCWDHKLNIEYLAYPTEKKKKCFTNLNDFAA